MCRPRGAPAPYSPKWQAGANFGPLLGQDHLALQWPVDSRSVLEKRTVEHGRVAASAPRMRLAVDANAGALQHYRLMDALERREVVVRECDFESGAAALRVGARVIPLDGSCATDAGAARVVSAVLAASVDACIRAPLPA